MSIYQKVVFPNVSGSNLNGDQCDFPHDFEKNLNVLIVAFRRNQVDLIETWLSTLSALEQEQPEVKFYELPVLSDSYGPLRWWIDGGMRAGIVDDAARRRTVTLYIDKGKFKKQLGIKNEETIYLFLVNREGVVLWKTEGTFSEEKLAELRIRVQDNLLPEPVTHA